MYVNTTILKTHMDLLIRESLCRPEQRKDLLSSLMTNGGGYDASEQSEEFTEYVSSPTKQEASDKHSKLSANDGITATSTGDSFGSGGDIDAAPIVEVDSFILCSFNDDIS